MSGLYSTLWVQKSVFEYSVHKSSVPTWALSRDAVSQINPIIHLRQNSMQLLYFLYQRWQSAVLSVPSGG